MMLSVGVGAERLWEAVRGVRRERGGRAEGSEKKDAKRRWTGCHLENVGYREMIVSKQAKDSASKSGPPSDSDLQSVDRWATVAIAARCAARVLPRVRAYWPERPPLSRDVLRSAVEFSIITSLRSWQPEATAKRITQQGVRNG